MNEVLPVVFVMATILKAHIMLLLGMFMVLLLIVLLNSLGSCRENRISSTWK